MEKYTGDLYFNDIKVTGGGELGILDEEVYVTPIVLGAILGVSKNHISFNADNQEVSIINDDVNLSFINESIFINNEEIDDKYIESGNIVFIPIKILTKIGFTVNISDDEVNVYG